MELGSTELSDSTEAAITEKPFHVVHRKDLDPVCPHCRKVLGLGQSRMA